VLRLSGAGHSWTALRQPLNFRLTGCSRQRAERGAARQAAPEAPGTAKRPREDDDANPAVKKRNRRMFGALLGTLQQFKCAAPAARPAHAPWRLTAPVCRQPPAALELPCGQQGMSGGTAH